MINEMKIPSNYEAAPYLEVTDLIIIRILFIHKLIRLNLQQNNEDNIIGMELNSQVSF